MFYSWMPIEKSNPLLFTEILHKTTSCLNELDFPSFSNSIYSSNKSNRLKMNCWNKQKRHTLRKQIANKQINGWMKKLW